MIASANTSTAAYIAQIFQRNIHSLTVIRFAVQCRLYKTLRHIWITELVHGNKTFAREMQKRNILFYVQNIWVKNKRELKSKQKKNRIYIWRTNQTININPDQHEYL